MTTHRLQKKAQKSFWYMTIAGSLVIFSTFILWGYTIFSAYTNTQPLLTKVEESCGCTTLVSALSDNSIILSLLGILGGALTLFFIYVVYVSIRLYRKTNSYVNTLHESKKYIPSPIVLGLADTLDLTNRIEEIDSPQPIVFTYGFLHPRILLSSAISNQLTIDELRAILEHESEHVRAYDPLKLYITKIISQSLFFIPGIRQLITQYEILSELSADESATNCYKAKGSLSRALYKVLGLKSTSRKNYDIAVSSFSNNNSMPERVRVLSDSNYNPALTHPPRKTFLFIFSLIALVSVFMVNLPESEAKLLEEGASQCILQAALTNQACRIAQEKLCEQNYSTIQTQLCNKTF